MARGINQLSAKAVENWKGPGRVSDGGGLYWDGRNWAFLYSFGGRRREMGLGAISLAKARELAKAARDWVAGGADPIELRRRDRAAGLTFEACAAETREVLSIRWTAGDAVDRWNKGVEACGSLRGLAVRDATVDDVAKVLRTITAPTKREYVQSIMRRVFDTAIAKRLRIDNPADTRVISKLVPLAHKGRNNAAMPYEDVPAFVKSLRTRDTNAALCLEWIIRTGVRKTEATRARWSEIDLAKGVWTIPAERTKKRREHTVPLTDPMLALLRECDARRVPGSDYVFPGSYAGAKAGRRGRAEHVSHGAFSHLLPKDTTVHGFRSALRDFLGNETAVSFVTAEEVLGHAVGDATVRAYRRTSGLAKRRAALQYWNDYVDDLHEIVKSTGNVTRNQLNRNAA